MNRCYALILTASAVVVLGSSIQVKVSDDEHILSRSKRLIIRNYYWNHGTIPYVFDKSVSNSVRKQYKEKVFSVYEAMSCIRFEPWNRTYHEPRLKHNNRLIFVDSKQCMSNIGNVGSGGQKISCCYWKTCLHEIGHAIGLLHEHNSPIRNDFIRVEQDNIIERAMGAFNMYNGRHYNIYDWQSIMHYGAKAWSKNGKQTILFLDNDLKPLSKFADTSRYYYLFMQINDAYQCAAKCNIDCTNGGYKAMMKGQCACMCPEGLNRTDSCSSLRTKDYNCGDIINLNETNNKVTINSPVIKGVKKDVTCYWYIKSPKNSRIYLDFKSYKILSADELAVRPYLPGNHGIVYNGKKITQSYTNFLSFSFSKAYDKDATSKTKTSSFQLEAYFKHEDEFCYNVTNGGKDYNGKVNFGKGLQPCLKWSEVTNCKHHAFNYKDLDKNLESNYCRNPDNSREPWCYIKKDGCIRNFCDACNFGQCKNTGSDCAKKIKKSPSYCKKNTDCRKTCTCNQLPSILDVSCSTPILPSDADQNVTLEQTYKVGKQVNVKCANNNDFRQITCLSDGSWTPLNFVCGTCKSGWISYGKGCYKVFNNAMTRADADNFCRNQFEGGSLLREYKWNHAFVTDMLNAKGKTCKSAWMDLTFDVDGSVYTWSNGDIVNSTEYSNWAGKTQTRWCVGIDTNCEWKDTPCSDKLKVACYYPRTVAPCMDQLNNCEYLKKSVTNFCDGKYKNSYAKTNCAKTCERCDTSEEPQVAVVK